MNNNHDNTNNDPRNNLNERFQNLTTTVDSTIPWSGRETVTDIIHAFIGVGPDSIQNNAQMQLTLNCIMNLMIKMNQKNQQITTPQQTQDDRARIATLSGFEQHALSLEKNISSLREFIRTSDFLRSSITGNRNQNISTMTNNTTDNDNQNHNEVLHESQNSSQIPMGKQSLINKIPTQISNTLNFIDALMMEDFTSININNILPNANELYESKNEPNSGEQHLLRNNNQKDLVNTSTNNNNAPQNHSLSCDAKNQVPSNISDVDMEEFEDRLATLRIECENFLCHCAISATSDKLRVKKSSDLRSHLILFEIKEKWQEFISRYPTFLIENAKRIDSINFLVNTVISTNKLIPTEYQMSLQDVEDEIMEFNLNQISDELIMNIRSKYIHRYNCNKNIPNDSNI